MKNLFTFFIIFFISAYSYAQTEGILTLSVSTSEAGGNYAPRNVVAIWVEDGAGNFLKTLLAYADNRKTHLNIWEESTTAFGSPFNSVDAITGATKPNHDIRTCTWDGTDVDGNLLPDGEYYITIELTDKNSTGNHTIYLVNKTDTLNSASYLDSPSFSDVTIGWTPDPSSVNDNLAKTEISFYPNPTTGKIYISEEGNALVTILTISGEIVYEGYNKEIDLSKNASGIYLIKLNLKDEVKFSKIFKE